MPFKVGQRAKVVGATSGHGMQVGSHVEVTGYVGTFVRVRESNMNFYEHDLLLLPLTKDEVIESLAKSKAEADILEEKMEYLEESFADEVNENQFKTYIIRKVLQDTDSSIEEKVDRLKSLFVA